MPGGERGAPAARGSPAWRGASPPPRLPFMACVRVCDRGERDGEKTESQAERERERLEPETQRPESLRQTGETQRPETERDTRERQSERETAMDRMTDKRQDQTEKR